MTPLDLTAGRADFGVVGRAEYGPLREALRISHHRWRPLVSLALLGGASAFSFVGLTLLTPELFRTIAVRSPVLLLSVRLAGLALGGVLAVRPAEAGRSRGAMALLAGAIAAASLALVGVATGVWQLTVGTALAGTSAGAAAALHLPLLVDHYRPEVRLRVLCIYAGGLLGGMGAAAVTAGLVSVVDLTWQATYLVMALVTGLAVVGAVPLGDRPLGALDAERTIRRIRERRGGRGTNPPVLADEEVEVATVEKLRQVAMTPTARPLLVAAAFWGLFTLGDRRYLLAFWADRWNSRWPEQAWLYALVCGGGLLGLAVVARRAEVLWRLDPSRVLRLARNAGLFGAGCLAASLLLPQLHLSVVLTMAASAAFAVSLPVVAIGMLSIAVPRLRGHASLLVGLAALAGGIVGQQTLDSVATRFGPRWALLASAAIAAAVFAALGDAERSIDGDLDDAIMRVENEEVLRVAVSRGEHLPLLGCRGIDYAYGPLQVLFDVDFTIDDGEIVALLGTNGAGKSTLLRVISGLGLPTRGAVHYRGSDITYVDAGRRVALGISQIPGGRAIFGPLSVLDNLRVFGFAHGRNQKAVDAGVEATLAAFPALAGRRHQRAATLSGGEQQMLALGKAFILQPRLLLIDELSLGLSPIVVGELLEMVRRINAAGTAVVLVEQSVTVALSLVDHAYFMEKGQIRFDGRAQELIERPDLLRSVFLEGAIGAGR